MNHFQKIRELLPCLGREASEEDKKARSELHKQLDQVVANAIQYGGYVAKERFEAELIERVNELLGSMCSGEIMKAYNLNNRKCT